MLPSTILMEATTSSMVDEEAPDESSEEASFPWGEQEANAAQQIAPRANKQGFKLSFMIFPFVFPLLCEIL